MPYVLNDFAKSERPWVEDMASACADFAELLAKGEDASFQNKVHLFMEAHGHGAAKRIGERASE
jgi:peptidyl-tRNA hydrolase, PTH1 family